MKKESDAFRTISEVSKELNVPQYVLRFWETRFSHIKPIKRGGGRRYYRPTDVNLIRGISSALYDQGYTIKGVQKLLKENGAEHIISLSGKEKQSILPEKEESLLVLKEEQGSIIEKNNMFNQDIEKISMKIFEKEYIKCKNISKENRLLLEKTLMNLLECKRLLDQVKEKVFTV